MHPELLPGLDGILLLLRLASLSLAIADTGLGLLSHRVSALGCVVFPFSVTTCLPCAAPMVMMMLPMAVPVLQLLLLFPPLLPLAAEG